MERKHEGREDRPAQHKRDEIGAGHPAKMEQASQKIAINQSGLGRSQGQTPAEEHIEPKLSENDNPKPDTFNLIENAQDDDPTQDTSGYLNDHSSADRDTGNAGNGWEESRTARHK